MPCLAGLKAEVVIWVAQSFREQLLSALRWLNEHRAEGISFFAVRLRVVQIGSSSLVPIFEVMQKPNNWDRQIKQYATSEGSADCDAKQAFWQAMLAQQPQWEGLGVRPWCHANNDISLGDAPRADISIFLARNQSGISVRAGSG